MKNTNQIIFSISTVLFLTLALGIFRDQSAFADCNCKVKVQVYTDPNGSITVKKIKSASVSTSFYGIPIVGTYSTRWSGTKKINDGNSHTFTLKIPNNCKNGKRRFKVERKDGKKCQTDYGTGDIEVSSRCGINTNSLSRLPPTIVCRPEDWR